MSVASASNANVARHLGRMSSERPTQAALKIPQGRSARGDIDYLTLDFRELDAEVDAWRARLESRGVKRGDRTLVMVRQGLPLIASVFGLFRLGAVPIIIDPGMGLKNFLTCVERSRPHALIGIPVARIISHIFRRPFASVRVRVAASGGLASRLTTSHRTNSTAAASLETAAGDLAAVVFTSGSTGAPKGVCYEHGMFEAQVRSIRETYEIQAGEIDLPLLPIFALLNPALGMTTIVPELDPRRPATLDPARIVRAIQQEKVTNSFGSPTLWRKIARHCAAHQISLPTLRRVLCAGAAVPADLWQAARSLLPNGQLHSPYGATEALPVASVSANEVDAGSVRGACVGRPVQGVDVRIIAVTDEPIAQWDNAHELAPGETGEIIVRGPMVTKTYDANPSATELSKIIVAPGSASPAADHPHKGARYHRMGDCGYFDDAGRLWFCGRKAERVETLVGTLHTEPCEQVFRRHPRAVRCALIGLGERGRQRPAIVIETRIQDSAEGRKLARELRALALEFQHTATIKVFYFNPEFPVDVRHNAKIHRLTLARWAKTAKGFESDPKR